MRIRLLTMIIISLSLAALAACGDDDGAADSDPADPAGPAIRVAIAMGDADDPQGLRIYDFPSGRERTAGGGTSLIAPRWSPDGQHLLALEAPPPDTPAPEGGYTSLAWIVFDHEGRETLRFDPSAESDHPVYVYGWSPDSEVLALTVGDEVRIVAADGDIVASAAQPAAGDPPRLGWSDDGQRVAVVNLAELVVLGRDGQEQRIDLSGTEIVGAEGVHGPPTWADDDIVTVHTGFFSPGGQPEYRAHDLSLTTGEVVADRQKDGDDIAERNPLAAANRELPADHLLAEAREHAPDGTAGVQYLLFNSGDGLIQAFHEPAASGATLVATTLVAVWEGVVATMEVEPGSPAANLHLGAVAAVGVAASE